MPSAIRQKPEKCCIRSRVFSLNCPCPRDTPKLKPQNHDVRAQRDADDARGLRAQTVAPPSHAIAEISLVRHQIGGEDHPGQQHAEVAHHAHKAGHEGGVRMQFFLEARLDLLDAASELGRAVDLLRQQKFCAEKQQENES